MEASNHPLSDNQQPENERGQSFTELAISLVFILILLAGVVDLGRAFFTFVALRDAAQEGAAYGSVCPTDAAGIQSRARTTSSTPVDLSDTTNILFSCYYEATPGQQCPLGAPAQGAGITVSMTASFKMTMPFLGGTTIPLSAKVTDTILTVNNTCP